MLAARLFVNVESFGPNDPVARHSRVLAEIQRPGSVLSDLERTLVARLIAADPRDRLARGYEIETAIADVLAALDRSVAGERDSRPLVVVVNPASSELVDRAVEAGFVPNDVQPNDPFNPRDSVHTNRLCEFIQHDVSRSQLCAVPNTRSYLLVGARMVLRLTKFESTDPDTGESHTWDFAFCVGPTELKWSEGGTASVLLPPDSVVVRTLRHLRDRSIRQNSRNWERSLPSIDRSMQLRASLARFHEFIRFTNQLELLIRDSELFRYKIISRHTAGGREQLTLEEEARERKPIAFAAVDGGMTAFLAREIESNKPDCRLVILAPLSADALVLPTVAKSDAWWVEQIDSESRRVVLSRATASQTVAAPSSGILRTWGMFGQVALIRRRKKAIDRLESHAYLLRSLTAPAQVYMDTGASVPTVPVPADLVDEAKQAAIRDILRVRPIYALQGPPGTGKTTLVAHLLRQIFEDDPVAQVLITAQAHGAVDVLRRKVRDEAFRGVPEEQQPLAVRLGLGSEAAGGEGSVEDVSLRILRLAQERLQKLESRTALQKEWLSVARELETALRTLEPESTAADFSELVKRGANITYCTTSAGDLEVLADATQSFDWAIVEEAGKAHGFDLALPLQAGHRWLLIGDHKQLPPYRFEDYREGIDTLDHVIAALEALPQRAGSLIDSDWTRSWRDRSSDEREEFKAYARTWLNTFERLFDYCSRATSTQKLTLDTSDGAAAGMLSRQHRMHPTIGDLISTAYYDGRLVNRTGSDADDILPRVQHGLRGIKGLTDQAIIWLDLPWVARNAGAGEVGPAVGRPRYTNPAEIQAIVSFLESVRMDHSSMRDVVDVAVLSPYNQQVSAISKAVGPELVASAGLALKQGLYGRSNTEQGQKERVAYSVDSFQGNQAGVIIVSLVRNNTMPPGDGLGFLREAARINVLLSRAERLLVLVGSWEFFQHQLQGVSVGDPHFPLWHLKKVVDTLAGWFESGRAVRIDASTLTGGRQ
jgi:hypothetical protein